MIHTASLHAPHASTHSEADFLNVNVEGTKNVLRVASSMQFTAMVHTSTTSRRLNRAFGEYLPQGVIDGRIQGALSAQRAGCMQPAPRVHVEVAGTDGAP